MAIAFSSTNDQRVVINKIKAQISDEIAVTQLNAMTAEKMGLEKVIQLAKKSHIFPFTQKLGVGYSIADKNAFDMLFLHTSATMFSPTAADMIQLSARIRSVTDQELFVFQKKNNHKHVIKKFPKPNYEACRDEMQALEETYVWGKNVKKMLSSYSPAAYADIYVRLVRGFTYISKMDTGKIQYQVPQVLAEDKLFFNKTI